MADHQMHNVEMGNQGYQPNQGYQNGPQTGGHQGRKI
jgi:hypothetical protein